MPSFDESARNKSTRRSMEVFMKKRKRRQSVQVRSWKKKLIRSNQIQGQSIGRGRPIMQSDSLVLDQLLYLLRLSRKKKDEIVMR